MILPGFSSTPVQVFQAVLETSWQGTLAILLVALVRQVLGSRVPARWRYALWLLVLARLLVPAFALPHTPASLQNVAVLNRPIELSRRMTQTVRQGEESPARQAAFPAGAPRLMAQGGSDGERSRPAALPAIPSVKRLPWAGTVWKVAAWTWLAGLVACVGWVLAGMWWWRRRLPRSCRVADPSIERVYQECCARLGVRFPPTLLATPLVASPALLGFLRPKLLIPKTVPDGFNARDWEHVFLHELAHWRRRDHWTQALELLVLSVHWFNPLVWAGMRALRADRELAADEQALGWARGDDAADYGETLLKTLRTGRTAKTLAPALTVGIMEEGASHLKERLRRIAAFVPGRAVRVRGVLGAAALGLLATVVLGQSNSAPGPTADDLALYADLSPVDQLHAAASSGDLAMLRKLLDEGVDPNATTPVGWERTALAIAANEHRLDAVKLLVARGANVNGPEEGKPSPALLAALRNGWLDGVDYLIAQGAKCDPVFLAAAQGDQAAVEKWLAADKPDFDRLRVACEDAGANGRTEIFARLYDAIRALSGRANWDIDHGTIRRVVARGQRGVVAEMIQRDSNLGKSVLRLATPAARSPGMREWFKSKGYDVPEANDHEWFIDAVDRDDVPEMRRWLAKGGIDVNYRGESGWTPLTKAAIDSRVGATKLLLAQGADPNLARFPGTMDYTPLCFASTPAEAEVLLAGGADLHQKTYNGAGTAMTYASHFGTDEMIHWFLGHGLLPNAGKESADGKPSLFSVNKAELVELLVARGADVNAKDDRGDSVLMHAVTQLYHPAGAVRALLKHGADPNFYSTYWKCTPLGAAADPDTVDALIEGGADINAKDRYGYSALCAITISSDDAARCEALLRHGLKLDVEKEGGRLMWLATARDQLGWVKLLLDHGVSANAIWYSESDPRGHGTPLGTATSFGRTEMVKLLLDHGATLDEGQLAFAMSKGYKDTARVMWERGVRTSSELAYAVSQGAPLTELARLIDSGVPVDPPQDNTFTPLNLAVTNGNLAAVKFLADRGANLENALGEAVQTGHDQIVEYLLDKGEKASWGLLTVLGSNSHPYQSEQPEQCFNHIAEMLIKAGALENLSEEHAANILRSTTLTRNPGGNPAILKLLFEHGLRVDSRFAPPSKPGEAAAANASKDGATFLEMAEKFSKKGVDDYSLISPETLKVIEEAKRSR